MTGWKRGYIPSPAAHDTASGSMSKAGQARTCRRAAGTRSRRLLPDAGSKRRTADHHSCVRDQTGLNEPLLRRAN